MTSESFAWVDSGTAWGVVAAGTTVLIIIVVVVLVMCMRGGSKDDYEKGNKLFRDTSYSGTPYTGMVSAVQMDYRNDGMGPMGPKGPLHPLGPPPPYTMVTSAEPVQPEVERKSPMMFGYSGSSFSSNTVNQTGLQTQSQSSNLLRPVSPKPDSLSNYSNSEDEEENPGKIWFTATYDKESKTLQVEVLKARLLAVRDRSSTLSESFIKVYLLPDEQNVFQTKSKRKTMTPKFNEKFTFTVSEEEIKGRVLRLSAYVMDRRSVRNCLGHSLVNLEDIDTKTGEVVVKELSPKSQPSQLGDINLSLAYLQQNDKLNLTINKCRNLKKLQVQPQNEFEAPSVYIKVQLICGRKQLDLKLTKVQPAQYDLEFNELMTFNLTQTQMGNSSLIVTVMRTKPSEMEASFEEIYGAVTIGPYMLAHGDELRHWQEVVTNPGATVTKWQILM